MRFKDNPFFWLIAGGLAVWRITNIIQKEEIASPIRRAAGIKEIDPEDPDYWIYPDNFIGKVFHCFWCGSVWIGTGIAVLLFVFPPLIIPFALSALAILVKSYIEQEPPTYIENMWMDGAGTTEKDDDLGEEDV